MSYELMTCTRLNRLKEKRMISKNVVEKSKEFRNMHPGLENALLFHETARLKTLQVRVFIRR
jgi:hypothetical protein